MSNETENNRLEKNGNELPSRGRISIEYRYYFSKNVYVLSVATGPMETVQEREREREIAFSVRRRRIERIVTMYLYERNEKEEGRTV